MKYPLMKNNITRSDLDNVIKYLKKKDPKLTQSDNVKKFEKLWSKWLGVKYSIFVNSGSSANLLTIAYLKYLYPDGGEIITSPFNWTSDINSIILYGFKPVFVDINFKNLASNDQKIIRKISNRTKAIFLTHAQGYNGLSDNLLKYLKKWKIILLEDVCESHGAKHKSKKLGTFGLISNFSFYYAHHMSTIEGGMICTSSKNVNNFMRSIRSHGLLREINDVKFKNSYFKKYKDLNSKFIFPYQGFNVRNNEIGAILGISQLKRLNKNIKFRNRNNEYFLKNINKKVFFVDFDMRGSSNYAFNLILNKKNKKLFDKICNSLSKNKIEYRVGSVGGGNQLRQPYLKNILKKTKAIDFPNTEHMHFYSCYIGNYPDLSLHAVKRLVDIINRSVC